MQQQILQAELDTVEENLEVLKQQGHDVSRGRRYLNNRYNSVSELLIVVPDRNVAPKSLPVLS